MSNFVSILWLKLKKKHTYLKNSVLVQVNKNGKLFKLLVVDFDRCRALPLLTHYS